MAAAKKCDTCKIRKEIEKSTEPACCIWYMDNVVLGDKNVNDCEIYQEDTEKQNSKLYTFGSNSYERSK